MDGLAAGDLVVIVGAHCSQAAADVLGEFHTVRAIRNADPALAWKCIHCGEIPVRSQVAQLGRTCFYPTRWLQKIRPSLQGVEVRECTAS